jgi:enterochelin esterase-like enzyme
MKDINARLIIASIAIIISSCSQEPRKTFYEDKVHFSTVFNHEKTYRIYLPDDYTASNVNYPVIYFFHGWGGRHFKDDNAKLDYERIDSLVEQSKVILVMWDGNVEESEPRPYNIGGHEDVKFEVQFKDYFPELVEHIDSTYRTLSTRENRGIIGYSMGGITSYFLAGKYPHMVCSAVNLTGSPEFFIGYPDNHTLYSLRHTFGNLHGVNLRFHNSTEGELAFLNQEVHAGALREKELNYIYEEFEGGHKVDNPGEIVVFQKAFDFVINSFENSLPLPARWNHADLYPKFDVWDYHVTSNLNEPGYIELKNVNKNGLSISTKKWIPDGPLIPGVKIKVQTAPIYEANSAYTVFDFNVENGVDTSSIVTSDAEGRISFSVNHEHHQIGIFENDGAADIALLDYMVEGDTEFLQVEKPEKLKLRLLNKGGTKSGKINACLSTSTKGIRIINPTIKVDEILAGESVLLPLSFEITSSKKAPKNAAPWQIRFDLEITDDNNNSWSEAFDVPIMFDVPAFSNIRIDDGLAAAENGLILGTGNGNGIPETGESIMIYTDDHRTRLYYDDKFIEASEEKLYDEMLPAAWPDGFTLSSIIKIADNCPDNHSITFLANYETKEHMPIKRMVHWGKINLRIF